MNAILLAGWGMNEQMDGWLDGWRNEWMDGEMNGWMNEWIG